MGATEARPALARLTFLKRVPARPATERSYEDAMALFPEKCNVGKQRLLEGAEVDSELVRLFNDRFAAGVPVRRGKG